MLIPSTVYTSVGVEDGDIYGSGSVGGSVWLVSSVRADPSRWWCPFFSRAIASQSGKTERNSLGILFILFISSLFCLFFFCFFFFFRPNDLDVQIFFPDFSLLRRGDLSNNISTAKRAPWCWKFGHLRVKENVFFKPECSDTVVCSSGIHRYRKHGRSTQVEEEQEKNKTRKRKWGRKNKTDTLGLLYVGHRLQRKEHRPFRPLL